MSGKDKHRPAIAEHEVVESPRRFPGRIKDIYSIGYDSGGGLDGTDPDGVDEDDVDSDEDGEGGDSDQNWTPEGLHVVSQTLRRRDNGFLFVDVVLGWTPLPGVSEYMLKVSVSADE